jgi:hypothetical protein
LVTIGSLDTPVGPGSTIGAVAIVNAIKVRTAEILVGRGDQDHDRNAGRLGLDAQEGRDPRAVRQVEVEHDRVDVTGANLRQRGGQRIDRFDTVWLAPDGVQGRADFGPVVGLVADE